MTSKLLAAWSCWVALLCLAVLARVDPIGQQGAGLLAALAGFLQSHLGVDAKG
nr:hypothetical protein [Thiorhodococcus drewsii]